LHQEMQLGLLKQPPPGPGGAGMGEDKEEEAKY